MEQQLALYDPLAARFVRHCVRCGQKMLGRSYSTYYGIFVMEDGSRVPVYGDPVHHVCPAKGSKPREVFHDRDTFGETAKTRGRQVRKVAPGIAYNLGTQRYEASHNKKRLGTHPTLEQAEKALETHLKNIKADSKRRRYKRWYEKNRQKEQTAPERN